MVLFGENPTRAEEVRCEVLVAWVGGGSSSDVTSSAVVPRPDIEMK